MMKVIVGVSRIAFSMTKLFVSDTRIAFSSSIYIRDL